MGVGPSKPYSLEYTSLSAANAALVAPQTDQKVRIKNELMVYQGVEQFPSLPASLWVPYKWRRAHHFGGVSIGSLWAEGSMAINTAGGGMVLPTGTGWSLIAPGPGDIAQIAMAMDLRLYLQHDWFIYLNFEVIMAGGPLACIIEIADGLYNPTLDLTTVGVPNSVSWQGAAPAASPWNAGGPAQLSIQTRHNLTNPIPTPQYLAFNYDTQEPVNLITQPIMATVATYLNISVGLAGVPGQLDINGDPGLFAMEAWGD